MNFTWFMARRLYSQGGGARRASRSAIVIATAGVAVGLAVMILSIAVVLGFKREVQAKVVGIGGHIQILNYQSLYATELHPIAITDSLVALLEDIPEVKHVQRFCQKTGMLKTDESFQGVVFRGVDEEYDLTFLKDCIVDGRLDKRFSRSESTGRLVVSQKLAHQLHLTVGSRVYAYFFDSTLKARRFTVEALYATHMDEYDSRLVFCDYKVCHQLLGFETDQSSGAEVNLGDMDQLENASEQVVGIVNHGLDSYGANYTSPTIKESYPHIFAWLDLLDLNVVVILLLMVAVAGFTTISGLLIIILERTQFIGILKALGANNRSLRHLFIYYAVFIIGRGLLWGNVLGLGLCLLQQHFGLVHLDASTYYVSEVPILISWPLIVLLNVLTFLLSTLALIVPSFVVSHIHPAKSIRFE
ncbi:MAG: ABC transporter permease [Bacteroidaceae bacterium]|nr:ABC transporter permease [Bacteroidaceae bacterium]